MPRFFSRVVLPTGGGDGLVGWIDCFNVQGMLGLGCKYDAVAECSRRLDFV